MGLLSAPCTFTSEVTLDNLYMLPRGVFPAARGPLLHSQSQDIECGHDIPPKIHTSRLDNVGNPKISITTAPPLAMECHWDWGPGMGALVRMKNGALDLTLWRQGHSQGFSLVWFPGLSMD